ncbi:MAG: septum site-determining protein MinC [Anaerolineae bacterium]|nr:septum site-determining protein MinC [Anaerolineae bacterium]
MIAFKGIREGLLLTISEPELKAALPHLDAELAEKQAFLQGSRVVLEGGSRRLNETQLGELQALLASYDMALWAVLSEHEATREAARTLGLATRLAGSDTDLDGNRRKLSAGSNTAAGTQPEANALLWQETVRSGQSVYHDGHVVVLGDVNPGAQIIAGGNVVVWGRLRGLVHAGAHGDRDARICALELVPTQLRIADQIAIPPADRPRQPRPEMATIREQQIVAEPWRMREGNRE